MLVLLVMSGVRRAVRRASTVLVAEHAVAVSRMFLPLRAEVQSSLVPHLMEGRSVEERGELQAVTVRMVRLPLRAIAAAREAQAADRLLAEMLEMAVTEQLVVAEAEAARLLAGTAVQAEREPT